MEPSGACTVRSYTLAARSRFTVAVGDVLPGREVSMKVLAKYPLAVERAMYWNGRSDGHASLASPSPDTDWYVPDGYTGGGFETWLLVFNPLDEQTAFVLTLMDSSGTATTRSYELGPRTRFTIRANDILPSSEFSAHFASDGPVIVEKSVYFSGRAGGTCSSGIKGTCAGP
jgi:hypothetical protein